VLRRLAHSDWDEAERDAIESMQKGDDADW
jgi:hypothetical protein